MFILPSVSRSSCNVSVSSSSTATNRVVADRQVHRPAYHVLHVGRRRLVVPKVEETGLTEFEGLAAATKLRDPAGSVMLE